MFILRYVSLLQFVLILMYILLPLLELYGLAADAEKPYPYRMLFPYNANPPLAYSITYFLTSLAGFGVVTNLFSEDSLFGFFTTHTCGRFRLLHERIACLMRNAQERALQKYPHLMAHNWSKVRNAIIQREYNEHLVRIIHDHRTLIRYEGKISWHSNTLNIQRNLFSNRKEINAIFIPHFMLVFRFYPLFFSSFAVFSRNCMTSSVPFCS